MTYHSEENKNHYFAPMLSNGDISFAVDAEGMIGYTLEDYKKKGINAFDGIVVRYARRSAMCNDVRARLFPFGKFTFSEGTPLRQWTQDLNVEKGFFRSECLYESGATIRSKGFIHPTNNIYARQKTFDNVCGTEKFTFDVTLCGYNKSISRYMQVLYTRKQEDICYWRLPGGRSVLCQPRRVGRTVQQWQDCCCQQRPDCVRHCGWRRGR